MTTRPKVKLGVEVFLEKHLNLVKSKRVGLITNPTGIDSKINSTIKLFAATPDIHLVALFGPEHGIRGAAQAGEYVPYDREKYFDLPVFSLYGQSKKTYKDKQDSFDDTMRDFDSVEEGKFIEPSMMENVDVFVFDIQDVGTRIYTYIATMAFAMKACAENEKEFIVLDRPNPINGIDMEGPILEYPEYSSFVGLLPIPVRHGMTIGEIALFYNANFLAPKAHLNVVPMIGWQRSMWFDETGLFWIAPSPNMPTLDTAIVYPGQVFLEGTNVSEGRGTTKPFEIFGAPWIDAAALAKALNDLKLNGAIFREIFFTPRFSKYSEQLCQGVQIHVTDRNLFKPFQTSMKIIRTMMDMFGDQFYFHVEYFDNIMGNARVRANLEKRQPAEYIANNHRGEIAAFNENRKPCLLY